MEDWGRDMSLQISSEFNVLCLFWKEKKKYAVWLYLIPFLDISGLLCCECANILSPSILSVCVMSQGSTGPWGQWSRPAQGSAFFSLRREAKEKAQSLLQTRFLVLARKYLGACFLGKWAIKQLLQPCIYTWTAQVLSQKLCKYKRREAG